MAHTLAHRPCTLRGCSVCSRRQIAEALAPFVAAKILPLREARRALRSKLSEEERAARIKTLRAELAELEGEAEGRGRTDEDETERRRRTDEDSMGVYPTYRGLGEEDEDERRTDEGEGLLRSNINDWSEPPTQGSNISRRKPEDNLYRGGRTGQQRSWGNIPGETGNLDPHRSDGRAREAINIFKRAGIVKG